MKVNIILDEKEVNLFKYTMIRLGMKKHEFKEKNKEEALGGKAHASYTMDKDGGFFYFDVDSEIVTKVATASIPHLKKAKELGEEYGNLVMSSMEEIIELAKAIPLFAKFADIGERFFNEVNEFHEDVKAVLEEDKKAA